MTPPKNNLRLGLFQSFQVFFEGQISGCPNLCYKSWPKFQAQIQTIQYGPNFFPLFSGGLSLCYKSWAIFQAQIYTKKYEPNFFPLFSVGPNLCFLFYLRKLAYNKLCKSNFLDQSKGFILTRNKNLSWTRFLRVQVRQNLWM